MVLFLVRNFGRTTRRVSIDNLLADRIQSYTYESFSKNFRRGNRSDFLSNDFERDLDTGPLFSIRVDTGQH